MHSNMPESNERSLSYKVPLPSGSTKADLFFTNPLILRKVLNFVSHHPVNYLHLRLVNRSFNEEFLHNMRRTHRNIMLCYDDVHLIHDTIEIFSIQVNGYMFRVELAKKFFQFLIHVCNVKVVELRAGKLHFLYNRSDKSKLHNDIMDVLLRNQSVRVLEGMENICEEGCDDCSFHALRCREYGPMQFGTLMGVFKKRRRHFEKLVVYETLFWKIAVLAVQESTVLEECMEVVRSSLANITCDHLQLVINEHQAIIIDDFLPPQPLPREVIEAMCEIWKVKTLKIKMICLSKDSLSALEWSEKKVFTEFRFVNPYETTLPSMGKRFEKVEISLEQAGSALSAIFRLDTEFQNLLANTERLFPTKQIFIKCDRRSWIRFDANRIQKIIEYVWKNERRRNVKVFMDIYTKHTGPSLPIPSSFRVGHRDLTCTVSPTVEKSQSIQLIRAVQLYDANYNLTRWPPIYEKEMKEWRSRTFKITDEVGRCELELRVTTERQHVQSEKEKGEALGFLEYLWA